MDLQFIFFQIGPPIKLIFNLNYIPQKGDFKELNYDFYKKLQHKMSAAEMQIVENQKLFAFIPEDEKIFNKAVEVYGKNYLIFGEEEIDLFEKTVNVIDNFCKQSGKSFDTLTEKLKYVASVLPDILSKDTPYAQ